MHAKITKSPSQRKYYERESVEKSQLLATWTKQYFSNSFNGRKKNLFDVWVTTWGSWLRSIPKLHKDKLFIQQMQTKLNVIEQTLWYCFCLPEMACTKSISWSTYVAIPVETDVTKVAGLLKQFDPYKAVDPEKRKWLLNCHLVKPY